MQSRDIRFTAICRFDAIWIAALWIVIFQDIGRASDPLELRDSSNLHGEFTVGKEGRLILLPVDLNGKQFHFMMDTGAGRSGIDVSLRDALGEPQGSQLLRTPAGQKRVDTYFWPDATLGGQSLKSNRLVGGVDFTELRQATNEKIFGVIGMDVLKNCRLQIDFDRGTFRFLDTLPNRRNELGVRIPIEIAGDNVPYIIGHLTDDKSEKFLIDTGAQGNSIRLEVFDELVQRNLIRLGGSFTSMTVNGEVQGSRGYLRHISVGPIAHDDLRVARVNPSSLGLRYFSRFLVTFDFPDQTVYLRNGVGHLKSEPQATSGMALVWMDGDIVVKSVKSGGPANRAGIRPNDVILRVDGSDVSLFDHFSLRQLLTSEGGKKVPMQIRRADRDLNVELTLDID